mmetsp:Transcript_12721/g.24799  ORF Transcript_12721/g.24799 Transcript_12721/m.24799 type:complete len:161 (+) Transcript_12721:905-1387(+)
MICHLVSPYLMILFLQRKEEGLSRTPAPQDPHPTIQPTSQPTKKGSKETLNQKPLSQPTNRELNSGTKKKTESGRGSLSTTSFCLFVCFFLFLSLALSCTHCLPFPFWADERTYSSTTKEATQRLQQVNPPCCCISDRQKAVDMEPTIRTECLVKTIRSN